MAKEIVKKEKQDFLEESQSHFFDPSLCYIYAFMKTHNLSLIQFSEYFITSFEDLIFNDVQPGDD